MAFLVTMAIFVVTKGKDYYVAPAFAALFAAGGVAIEGFTASARRRWPRPALVALQIPMLLFLPLGLPILRVDRLIAWQERLGLTLPASEKAHARAALPHHFAWQFVFIVLGDRPEGLEAWCGDVQTVAELSHPWGAVWENKPVLVCREPRQPLAEIWPKIKNWD